MAESAFPEANAFSCFFFFFPTLKNVLDFTTDSPASLCSSPSKHPHTASKLAQYATQGVGRPGCRGRMTNSGAPPGHASGVGRWEVEVRRGGALTAKNHSNPGGM